MKQTLHATARRLHLGGLTLGISIFYSTASGQTLPSDTLAIGYGQQSVKPLTSSQTTLTPHELNKGFLASPEQLLVGSFPGLLVSPVSGAPGARSQIRIRQGSSFASQNQPLVVLNGVPLYSDTMLGVDNTLSFLNLDDIASVTVLKDASATTIYGSRGSNGVIFITTQKNNYPANGFSLSLNTTGSMATVAGKIPVLSANEFRSAIGKNVGQEYEGSLGPAQTDWQEEIYRTAYGANNQLNLNGALGKLPYHVSVGYINQNGVLRTSKFRRTSAALNLQPSLLKEQLKFDVNLRGASSITNFTDPGVIYSAANFDPTKPVKSKYNSRGYFTYLDDSGKPLQMAPYNPLSLLEQPEDKGTSNRNIASISADYAFPFLSAMHAQLDLALDHAKNQRTFSAPHNMAKYAYTNGLSWKNEQTVENKFLEFNLNYSKALEAINSRFRIMAGLNRQSREEENLYGSQFDADGHEIKNSKGNSNTHTLHSVFGRLNYTFANRLEVNATLRNDGSSRFSETNRYFLSRVLGLSWNMAGVGFTKNLPSLTNLTWRASYGTLGKMDWNSERTQLLYVFQMASISPDFKPASSTEFNVGLDAGWFHNRLQATFDLYNSIYKDQLLQVPVAYGSNINGYVLTNYGSYKTYGFEWDLSYKMMQNENLEWQLGLNGAFEDNEVRDFGTSEKGALTGDIAGVLGTVQIHRSGYPASAFYVYKQLYGPKGELLPGQFADTNKDGFYTNADRYPYKSATPKVHGGFRSYLKFKRLDLSFLLHGQAGNYTYNNVAAVQGGYKYMYAYQNYFRNVSKSVLETELQEMQPVSDYYIQNASFLRLEHLQLAYNIGTSKNNRPLLRISATLQNAFTLTKYKGQEPGIAGGIDGYTYAQPRIISLGFQLNLF